MIGIVLLLVVGPKKLPDVAKDVGKGLKKIRRVSDQLRDSAEVDEIKRAVYGEPGQTPAWKRPVAEHLQELIDGEELVKQVQAPLAPRPPAPVTEDAAPEPAPSAGEPALEAEPEDDGRPVPRLAGPAAAAAAAAAVTSPAPETQDGSADGERTRPA